jgi:threonine aldolase
MLGGGMRQAGVIAAAGIIAIEKMVDRLRDDHTNAQILAKGLASTEGISVDLSQVQTNIVVCDVAGLGITGERWIAKLNEFGVKVGALEGSRVRLVTHRGIEKEDIEYALRVVEKTAPDFSRT